MSFIHLHTKLARDLLNIDANVNMGLDLIADTVVSTILASFSNITFFGSTNKNKHTKT